MRGETVLVVALSARALAQAARRAGYAVHTIDLFADEDTRQAAQSARAVRASGGMCFDAASLRETLPEALAAERFTAIVPGSGFEWQPELVDELIPSGLLAGNSSAVVRAVKDPLVLGCALERFGIPYPAVISRGRVPEGDWLLKQVGGSGGGHVMPLAPGVSLVPGTYAQRRVSGRSMSALFLANGETAMVLGCCLHWCAQPRLLSACQHSGLVRLNADQRLQSILSRWAIRLAAEFRLRGLCGMDFILGDDGAPVLLEVNPRPPASFELFEAGDSLFAAHLAACRGELRQPATAMLMRASAVFYAVRDCEIPGPFRWPEWTADRPLPGSRIAAVQPLCTVLAECETVDDAIAIAQRRIHELDTLFA